MTYDEPMTGKQRTYLATLLDERTWTGRLDAYGTRLLLAYKTGKISKPGATRLIDRLKDCPRTQAAQTALHSGSSEMEAEVGYYLFNDEVVHVERSKANPERHIARRMVPPTHKGDRGRWVYTRGLVWRLKAEHRLTDEQARTLSRQYGVCILCGNTLSDPKSVEQGIGPHCARKLRESQQNLVTA